MHAARRHEAAAKRAMREAISQGRVAADAAMKERKVSEQTGEEARDISEAWAEGHEEARLFSPRRCPSVCILFRISSRFQQKADFSYILSMGTTKCSQRNSS